MDLRSCRHWVFDMDGTLTVAAHDFDAIRAELGLPAGRPILEALAELSAGEAGPRRARLEAIERRLARAARPAPGAGALLGRLRGRGARLGVLTRNSLANARLTLVAAGLAGFFEETDVVTRDHGPPKPSPEGLLALLSRWGASPAQAMIVGDHRFDLEVGRAAGVRTVLVDPGGRFPWADLADHTATGLDELAPDGEAVS